MEKVIKFLGGKKNGTDHTGVFEVYSLVKNIVLLLLAFGSVTFSAGKYFGDAKDLPPRVATLERRQDLIDAKLESILSKLDSTSSDVRELRACIMRGQNDR